VVVDEVVVVVVRLVVEDDVVEVEVGKEEVVGSPQ